MDRAADAADPAGWDGTPLRHVASTDLLGGSVPAPPDLRGLGNSSPRALSCEVQWSPVAPVKNDRAAHPLDAVN